jgi:hypothetical protein
VMRRVTMADAAQVLGISKEAVRKRIKRGTLRSEMGEDGRRYVYLDSGGDAGPDAKHAGDDHARRPADPRDPDRGYRDELIEELRDRVRALEEANRENRRIIAALTSRIPEIQGPQEEDSATPSAGESTERSQWTPTGDAAKGETPSAATGEPPRRSWWQRFLGVE